MLARHLLLGLLLVAAFLVGGSALAEAQSTPTRPQVGGGVIGVAAEYVGLTRREVVMRLRGGQSLAQLAVAQGKSVEGLKQALLDAFKARIDARVAANRLTQAQAQRLLERAPVRIDRLVNRVGRPGGMRGARVKTGLLKVAADYVGITPRQLRTEFRSGSSLAQIATAHGKSVAGLKAALLAALKAKVEAAVAANRLTQAQAQRLLARAEARIDRLVTRTRASR